MSSNLKVLALMAALTALFIVVGNAIGGQSGAVVAFVIALGMNFFSYWFSDSLALRMAGAEPLSEEEAPELHAMVERLAARAGIPKPRVYITPSMQPNAFATGRNPAHSAVAVTQGIMRILNRDEIEGVLAHEIGHIKNRDVLISTIAAVMAGAITMIANAAQWGLMFGGLGGRNDEEEGNSAVGMVGSLLMIILAPIAAMLIQMAISRSREFLADQTGARLTGRPQGLANALLKLEQAAHHIPMEVSPAASHMFIVQPLFGGGLIDLFSTHPPIAERVRRLQALAL